ncbi:MAG: hypothetical protein V7690_05245 [Shewanella sp.]|uniref:hypothetical protein n=1 Tax=Shewanella sp. TaxID=50422 RepID=UPI00300333FD
MTNILDLTIIKANLNIAVLNVDVDTDAERLVLLNRNPIFVHSTIDISDSNLVKVRVPMNYATSGELLLILLDDDFNFNAVIADGVKAEIIKTSEF